MADVSMAEVSITDEERRYIGKSVNLFPRNGLEQQLEQLEREQIRDQGVGSILLFPCLQELSTYCPYLSS